MDVGGSIPSVNAYGSIAGCITCAVFRHLLFYSGSSMGMISGKVESRLARTAGCMARQFESTACRQCVSIVAIAAV